MNKYVENRVDLLAYTSILQEQQPNTFEVYVKGSEIYHQLEPGYIPVDNVSITVNESGKLQSAGNADWSATEGTSGYVKNRTHYKETTIDLEEEHQYNQETGEDPLGFFQVSYVGYEQCPINNVGWHYIYDDNEPDGGAGGRKITELLAKFENFEDETVFDSSLQITGTNTDFSLKISESNLKLHKHIINEVDSETGDTLEGTIIEICPDYFYTPKEEEDEHPIIEGPGLYFGVSHLVENSNGDMFIHSDCYICLYEQYLIDNLPQDVSFENYHYNIAFGRNELLKLNKEYLPQVADWDISDENDPGYIKNRTHYRTEDTQEPLGSLDLAYDPRQIEQQGQTTTSGHSFTGYGVTGGYIYEDGEGDNTLFHALEDIFTGLERAWRAGIRKININFGSDFIYTCNLLREYREGNHQYWTDYYLTLDDCETTTDAQAIFDTDQNSEGETVESKGILMTISAYHYDAT